MGIQFNKTKKDGRTLYEVMDESSGTAFTCIPEGAELVSLRFRNKSDGWQGVLYRDGQLDEPDTGWQNHATVMGYYLHRILNEHTTYRGLEIRGGTHSFLRHKRFESPVVLENGIEFEIATDQFDACEYPYRVGLKLGYLIEDGKLRVRFHFQNEEPDVSVHVSFGLHPGFAVSSKAGYDILLPKGTCIRHLAPGNFLSGETEWIEFAGGPMPFDKNALEDSYIVEFKHGEDRTIKLADHITGRKVELDFSEVPYFTIWSNDMERFVCIEPCWGLPDHHEQRPFEQKAGIQEIAAGGELTASFTIHAV